MSSGMPQFITADFAPQIFWTFAGFAVLYAFVSRFASPRLLRVRHMRAVLIDDMLLEAEDLQREAARLQSAADALYKKAVGQASELTDKVRRETETAHLVQVSALNAEVNAELHNKLAAVALEVNFARQHLHEAATVAAAALRQKIQPHEAAA